jgi:hypothetical protein
MYIVSVLLCPLYQNAFLHENVTNTSLSAVIVYLNMFLHGIIFKFFPEIVLNSKKLI